ncbi:acyltransferase [Pedobacter sp. L105]|uniref:acyltransferase n=1 Tax=Pedobacter sp. L105 TaxID=1641871 RepID=UPI00131DBA19|nr:acyltransferase [Pedobacter sp. L105]
MMAKTIRLIGRILHRLSNTCRRYYLQLKYPGLSIDRHTVMERGCKIICIDGGKMELVHSFISAGAYLFADKGAKVMLDHVHVGRYSHIVSKASITLQFGVSIAEMVVIRDQDHVIHPDHTAAGIVSYRLGAIVIGKHAWIAAKATILKGVTVGDHAIIAASAVVTKPVPRAEVWGGIPAKFIKKISNSIP